MGERGRKTGTNWEIGIDMYTMDTISCVKERADEQLRGPDAALWCLNGKEIRSREDICVHGADSLCGTAETKLQSNYTSIKI